MPKQLFFRAHETARADEVDGMALANEPSGSSSTSQSLPF